MKIKAVIFDLGGVIININYNATIEAFCALGLTRFKEIYNQFQQSDLFDRYETGLINCDAFRTTLLDNFNFFLTEDLFNQAWNAMLLDIPQDRLDIIKEVRDRGYKTYLFSNTNPIHYAKVLEILSSVSGNSNFDTYFDRQFYSHLFGKRKPHASSFRQLLQDIDCAPEEVIFLDDSKQHVDGASTAGIHAFLIDNNTCSINNVFSLIEIANEKNIQVSNEKDYSSISCGI